MCKRVVYGITGCVLELMGLLFWGQTDIIYCCWWEKPLIWQLGWSEEIQSKPKVTAHVYYQR